MTDKVRITSKEKTLREGLKRLAMNFAGSQNTLSKKRIRDYHLGQRLASMASLNGAFNNYLQLLRDNLAHPFEIDIAKIRPELTIVDSRTEESELFKAASLLWSVPVSRGFGRRMRFLVRDIQNGKLIGIIGLTDPVFNLTPRDAWVGWNSQQRMQRLINVMDAFVLGAMPPYNKILAGKLIALIAASKEVVHNFRIKYRNYTGIISETKKDPRLVLLTTSSALGRSSLYNRLRIPDGVEYLTGVECDRVSTWYTRGYGHFHIPDRLFWELQNLLVRRRHPYSKGNRFGDGPNWKIRLIREATHVLGVDPGILQHGIRRQVYLVPLASNTRSYLLGNAKHPRYITKRIDQITEFWLNRWAEPRSERYPDWRGWNSGGIISNLKRLYNLTSARGDTHNVFNKF